MPQYFLTFRDHTKQEAKESMRGLKDFQRNHHRRGFFTCCRDEREAAAC